MKRLPGSERKAIEPTEVYAPGKGRIPNADGDHIPVVPDMSEIRFECHSSVIDYVNRVIMAGELGRDRTVCPHNKKAYVEGKWKCRDCGMRGYTNDKSISA